MPRAIITAQRYDVAASAALRACWRSVSITEWIDGDGVRVTWCCEYSEMEAETAQGDVSVLYDATIGPVCASRAMEIRAMISMANRLGITVRSAPA